MAPMPAQYPPTPVLWPYWPQNYYGLPSGRRFGSQPYGRIIRPFDEHDPYVRQWYYVPSNPYPNYGNNAPQNSAPQNNLYNSRSIPIQYLPSYAAKPSYPPTPEENPYLSSRRQNYPYQQNYQNPYLATDMPVPKISDTFYPKRDFNDQPVYFPNTEKAIYKITPDEGPAIRTSFDFNSKESVEANTVLKPDINESPPFQTPLVALEPLTPLADGIETRIQQDNTTDDKNETTTKLATDESSDYPILDDYEQTIRDLIFQNKSRTSEDSSKTDEEYDESTNHPEGTQEPIDIAPRIHPEIPESEVPEMDAEVIIPSLNINIEGEPNFRIMDEDETGHGTTETSEGSIDGGEIEMRMGGESSETNTETIENSSVPVEERVKNEPPTTKKPRTVDIDELLQTTSEPVTCNIGNKRIIVPKDKLKNVGPVEIIDDDKPVKNDDEAQKILDNANKKLKEFLSNRPKQEVERRMNPGTSTTTSDQTTQEVTTSPEEAGSTKSDSTEKDLLSTRVQTDTEVTPSAEDKSSTESTSKTESGTGTTPEGVSPETSPGIEITVEGETTSSGETSPSGTTPSEIILIGETSPGTGVTPVIGDERERTTSEGVTLSVRMTPSEAEGVTPSEGESSSEGVTPEEHVSPSQESTPSKEIGSTAEPTSTETSPSRKSDTVPSTLHQIPEDIVPAEEGEGTTKHSPESTKLAGSESKPMYIPSSEPEGETTPELYAPISEPTTEGKTDETVVTTRITQAPTSEEKSTETSSSEHTTVLLAETTTELTTKTPTSAAPDETTHTTRNVTLEEQTLPSTRTLAHESTETHSTETGEATTKSVSTTPATTLPEGGRRDLVPETGPTTIIPTTTLYDIELTTRVTPPSDTVPRIASETRITTTPSSSEITSALSSIEFTTVHPAHMTPESESKLDETSQERDSSEKTTVPPGTLKRRRKQRPKCDAEKKLRKLINEWMANHADILAERLRNKKPNEPFIPE